MLEMVNLSLDLSRMELGTYAFRPQAVDLADVIGRVLLDLQGLAGPAGVQVRWEDGKDAPVYARAEELLCYSVLANVLKNAIEATPHGGTVTVRLQAGDPLRVLRAQSGPRRGGGGAAASSTSTSPPARAGAPAWAPTRRA